MIKTIPFLTVMVLLTGCFWTRSVELADVTRTETVILRKMPGQGPVHSLSIRGSGTIQGHAEITLILNDASYKMEELSGQVDFQWGGDWDSDEAEIRYKPTSVTSGSLKLRYKFND